MRAAPYNLYVETGADLDLNLTLKDTDGNIIDLTDYSIEAMIARDYGDVAVAVFTGTITDAVNGVASLSLPNTESSKLTFTKGVWIVELVEPSGKIRRIIQGRATISLGVTDA